MKICGRCCLKKPLEEFYRSKKKSGRQSYCKTCTKEFRKEYCRNNPEKIRLAAKKYRSNNLRAISDSHRKYTIRLAYGISDAEYQAMFSAQGGKCAICQEKGGGGRSKRFPLDVDHCHKSGKVRGLLCGLCNRGVGQLKDSPEILRAAILYLEKP